MKADVAGRALETAERADANFVVHVTWALERTPGMIARVRDELVVADSGLPCDTFNFICRARLDSAAVTRVAGDAVSYFGQVERPFSWWVGPADRPRELGAVLEALGLERAETELAMALRLEALPGSVAPVRGLEVRRVRTSAELELLARLTAGNWDPPDPHVLSFYRRTARALLQVAAPQRFYIGYFDGAPVATAEATVEAGTVGLYNIATAEAFRGRGIASSLTWHALHDARDDCDLAVLQAAAAGVGLYQRLGFVSFGEITEYKPRASS
jgi:ribosomal protein S18 acetylase RimI-like enzyme